MLEIGKKLRTLRQQKNWSQKDVAKLLHISVAAFSKIETDVTDISLSRLQQIADAFQINISEFLLPQTEQSKDDSNELVKARETIAANAVKIMQLQEYIITLYEQINALKENFITER